MSRPWETEEFFKHRDEAKKRFPVPPQTNYYRIISKTPEELADWIAEVLTYHTRASSDPHKGECHTDCPLYRCCNDQPSDNIEDWLKSPVED